MTESDDKALVQRSREGDQEAFTALVRKYQSVVYNCAYRILGNSSDAEDVSQASFLKIYDKLHSFDSKRTFFSWMYRITVNEAIDCKRKDRDVSLQEDLAGDSEGPQGSLEQSDLTDLVQSALMRLPEDARAVLVLRHFQELRYDQIAEILDLPEKTVKSRLYSARQNLKNLLKLD